MKIEKIYSIGFCLFLLMFIPSIVKASVSCQKEYYINGTAYINDTCVLNDEELERDVYGNLTGSGPKDMLLDEIKQGYGGNPITNTTGLTTIDEVCDDPYLQQYLSRISTLPPLQFVDYVKSLGYDDETHINMIWAICQEKTLNSMGEYINQNQNQWASDDKGISLDQLTYFIDGAVNWLLGKEKNPYPQERMIATSLDQYFASDQDTYYLYLKMKDLELRVEALENAVNTINPDVQCQGKLQVLEKYNLSAVSCGDTLYHNHFKDPTGQDVIYGIGPVNDGTENSTGKNDGASQDDNTQIKPDTSFSGDSVSVTTTTVLTMANNFLNRPISVEQFLILISASAILSCLGSYFLIVKLNFPKQKYPDWNKWSKPAETQDETVEDVPPEEPADAEIVQEETSTDTTVTTEEPVDTDVQPEEKTPAPEETNTNSVQEN